MLNLNGFVHIPGQPGYLAHPDGRIASLKKETPRLLATHIPARETLATVRLGHTDIRVRDITLVMFGTLPREAA